ncbi:MAG: XRE family transcriptional regulator [Alphaproteobacteria bacterium]|nr:XRE family transcriptional regulator [Alphaproteobacteria bacterium]
MTTTLKDVMERLPAGRRKKVVARADALVAEAMTLRDLRLARRYTQKNLARKLRVGQDGISRIEQRSDLLLSTLRHYVSAMGGSLKLVAKFPDRPDVVLGGLGSPDREEKGPARKRRARSVEP